jgi:hypothetical protein
LPRSEEIPLRGTMPRESKNSVISKLLEKFGLKKIIEKSKLNSLLEKLVPHSWPIKKNPDRGIDRVERKRNI